MIRLAHISDLHFGSDEEGRWAALLDRLAALRPDIVAISGDLTQRARSEQFQSARAFLDRLPAPWIAVPGNHDIPLVNLVSRVFSPFSGYRRHISSDLEPVWEDDGVLVIGVNTVDPLAHQAGRFRHASIDRVARLAGAAPPGTVRIVMLHHPLVHGPLIDKRPMSNAETALAAMADCGVDIVLSGHLHAWDAEVHKAMNGIHETLLIQAGTATSWRRRGNENDFNLLEVSGRGVRIERWVAGGEGAFSLRLVQEFHRDGRLWIGAAPRDVGAQGDGGDPASLDI